MQRPCKVSNYRTLPWNCAFRKEKRKKTVFGSLKSANNRGMCSARERAWQDARNHSKKSHVGTTCRQRACWAMMHCNGLLQKHFVICSGKLRADKLSSRHFGVLFLLPMLRSKQIGRLCGVTVSRSSISIHRIQAFLNFSCYMWVRLAYMCILPECVPGRSCNLQTHRCAQLLNAIMHA